MLKYPVVGQKKKKITKDKRNGREAWLIKGRKINGQKLSSRNLEIRFTRQRF